MININFIKHNQQRYNTVGDWQFNMHNDLFISVSESGEPHTDILVAIHELIEAYLCKANGVSEASVDQWDLSHISHPDPGSIPGCPYYREHMFATMIERSMCAELGHNWTEHEELLENICRIEIDKNIERVPMTDPGYTYQKPNSEACNRFVICDEEGMHMLCTLQAGHKGNCRI